MMLHALVPLLVPAVLFAGDSAGAAAVPAVGPAVGPSGDPPVQIWLNNDRRFERGDRARVEVRAREDGYLIVLHVDPDGRLRVLFPLDPGEDNFVRGGRRYEVEGRGGRESFTVDDPSGQGVVFAAVAPDPLRFGEFVRGDHWDYRVLAPSRLPSDPEPELVELVGRMAPGGFDYDILTYEVEPRRAYASRYPTSYVHHHHYNYVDWWDPYYDPWYSRCYRCYGSSFTISLRFGRPYYPRAYVYDPYFHDPFFYDPFYYRPARVYFYDPYPYRYYYGPYGYPYGYGYGYGYGYRYPRAYDSYRFKSKFGGGGDGFGYRDRYVFKTADARNTVYGPPPRRLTTQPAGEGPRVRRAFEDDPSAGSDRYLPRSRREPSTYQPRAGVGGEADRGDGTSPRRRGVTESGTAESGGDASPRDRPMIIQRPREESPGLREADRAREPGAKRRGLEDATRDHEERERPREAERPRDYERPREIERPREYERPREMERPREAPRYSPPPRVERGGGGGERPRAAPEARGGGGRRRT